MPNDADSTALHAVILGIFARSEDAEDIPNYHWNEDEHVFWYAVVYYGLEEHEDSADSFTMDEEKIRSIAEKMFPDYDGTIPALPSGMDGISGTDGSYTVDPNAYSMETHSFIVEYNDATRTATVEVWNEEGGAVKRYRVELDIDYHVASVTPL